LSCAVGPGLAWLFFYAERHANAIQAAYDYWVLSHPTCPLQLMPAWLKWEDTKTSEVEAEQNASASM
jgi:hypothetical protein